MECSRRRLISVVYNLVYIQGQHQYHWMIFFFLLFFPRGRFGQVHKCEEKATGLKLAAKIIKAKGPKQKVGRM